MRKYPNFTIEFNQSRLWSRPDMSTVLDSRMKTIYEDRETIYNHPAMIAGPYKSNSESVIATFEGKPAATAMLATVDRASGRLNLEIRKWQLETSLFGRRSETVRYMGSCDTIQEAKTKLGEFARECQNARLSLAKTPTWIDGFYSHAVRIHDLNAKPIAQEEPVKQQVRWPGLSVP